MMGCSACEKPTQPLSVNSAISVSASPARPRVSAPSGNKPAQAQLAGTELQHVHQAGLIERRIGVGRADQAGHTAGRGRIQFRLQHAFMLVTGFAQPRRQVNQARCATTQPLASMTRAEVSKSGGNAANGNDASGGHGHIGAFVAATGWVDHAAVANQDFHASFPAMIDITAMRTAMPKVTCGRITLCVPSATADAISTPRLIGPGCMTMASDLASASLSSVRP